MYPGTYLFYGALSFSPRELAGEIREYIPGFKIDFLPDYRQQIAESWPQSIEDSTAKKDWGWEAVYDLKKMTRDMIFNLKSRMLSSSAAG
ncbi:MAG TPA: hypothetical protein VFC34_14570 [Puia sp.]|nr:hypothetical protein [Puia sp.]